MDKSMLKQMLEDIKEECNTHERCKDCPLYAGQFQKTMCMMDAQSEIYANPGDWDINRLMKLKDED